MKFYSADFGDYQTIPPKYTCEQDNVSPAFIISDVPSEASELILMCHDPDATGGNDWTHWIVTNISPSTQQISDANLPKGAKTGISSFGKAEYGGPCPPTGSPPHRYVFSLYALDKSFKFDEADPREKILKDISGHVLAQETWTGIYQR